MNLLRVLCLNMHMGVPEGLSLVPDNEDPAALADLAEFVCDCDPDVVLLQEVRNDAPASRGGAGVPRQFEWLRAAVQATGSAYGLAVASNDGDEYGICIMTRRGVILERPEVAYLPFAEGREQRLLLFAQAVSGDHRFTVANVHLDHTGLDRRGQLAELERVVGRLLTHGDVRIAHAGFDYVQVSGYEGPLVLGGDFNDAADIVADALSMTALVNVVDGLDAGDPLRGDSHVVAGRIDHLLLSPDIRLLSQDLREVPMRALKQGSGVTDHLALLAEVILP